MHFFRNNFGLVLAASGSFFLGAQITYLFLSIKYRFSKRPVCTCGPSSENGCEICYLSTEGGLIKLSKDEIKSMRKGKVDWG